jgi:hypothetical protein
MVKHHQKKKKKLSKSKKDEANREREMRLNNLDQFAGSSDEEGGGNVEEDAQQPKRGKAVVAQSDSDGDEQSGDSSDDYEQYDQGPRRRGGVGARRRSASVGNEADGEEDESSDEDDEDDEREHESSKTNKGRRMEEAASSDDDGDGDAYGDDEFGADRDEEMESADEFEGGDTSLSAVASKSAGMAGAMARILGGTGSAPLSQEAPSSRAPTTTNATGSVILSKTKTPLQKLQEKQKSADAALREKRRQRRETNLTAMHVPLSAATSRPLSLSEDGRVVKSAIAQELEEERAHRRVATRGVVALFNAISKHQDKMREEASAEHRAAARAAAASGSKSAEEVKAMSKRGFLDMLKTNATKVGGGSTTKAVEDKSDKDAASSKSKSGGWNALKDDFMMTSKLKDWDKELSEDEDSDDDDDEAGGGGGAVNDDWSDDDERVSSASKRQRVRV